MTASQLLRKTANILVKEFMGQPPPQQYPSSPPPYSEYPTESNYGYAPLCHQNEQQLPAYCYQYDYSNYHSIYQGEHGAGALLQNMWMLADMYDHEYL